MRGQTHDHGYLSSNILDVSTNLDGFAMLAVRNLNKRRNWHECRVSCTVDRSGNIDGCGSPTYGGTDEDDSVVLKSKVLLMPRI